MSQEKPIPLEDYEIREARGEDTPRLIEFRKKITEHSYGANPDFLRRSESAWAELPDQYQKWIQSDDVCFLVAEQDAHVVAMVIGHNVRTESLVPGHFQ